MKRKKRFKKGKKGWWMGSRLTVLSARIWNGDRVYQVRFDGSKKKEYYSHRFLVEEKVFQYHPETGEYLGEGVW